MPMIFTDDSKQLLNNMRIDPEQYSQFLTNQFAGNAKYFELMCRDFYAGNPNHDKPHNEYFLKFLTQQKIQSRNDKFCNYLQEWNNNLEWFWDEGVLYLFQNRNQDWGTPEIKITEVDVPMSDINSLRKTQLIFRGMSKREHKSGNFGQSWTLQKKVARQFAKHTYEDQTDGTIVKTEIDRSDILYYDKSAHNIEDEDEVIIRYGSVSSTNVTICE